MNGWTNCADGMPDNDKLCLVVGGYGRGPIMALARYWELEWIVRGQHPGFSEIITHWRYAPDYPKEVE